MRGRLRPVAIVVAVTALLLGACGGDDGLSEEDRAELCERAQTMATTATSTTAALQDPATDLEEARTALLDLIGEVKGILDDIPGGVSYAEFAPADADASTTTAADDGPTPRSDADALEEQIGPIEDRIETADLADLRTDVLADLVELFQPPTLRETPATRLLGTVAAACPTG